MNPLELLIAKQERLRKISSAYPVANSLPKESITYQTDGAFLAPVYKDEKTWGSNCWFTHANWGSQSPSESKKLFTEVAAAEFEKGIRNFYVEILADDHEELQSWYELGFGQQHASGLLTALAPTKTDALIRNADVTDIAGIIKVERELALHQMKAPVFSAVEPDDENESANDWRELFESENEDGFVVKVAEVNGEVVALSYGVSTEKSSLHSGLLRPENSATLAHATTLPEYRGKGIGKALASAVINDLKGNGFKEIVTDWRITNQLSSVTWPKLGFKTTLIRLHRAL